MSRLYPHMTEAVINGISQEERDSIPRDVLVRIIDLCADAAEQHLAGRVVQGVGVPSLPRLVQIRAGLLRAEDWVFQPDFSFKVVAEVQTDVLGTRLHYEDDTWEDLYAADCRRIACDRFSAAEWNRRREHFSAATITKLNETYGVLI